MNLTFGRFCRATRSASSSAIRRGPASTSSGRTKGLAAAALLAVVATGCVTPSTSQAESTPDTKPELTADQAAIAPYVKEADAICETARTTMAANLAAFEVHKSVSGSARRKTVRLAKPNEVAAYVKGQLIHLETQQTAIRKLTLPEGASGKQLDALWTEAESIMKTVKEDPEATAYNDPFRPVAQSLEKLGFNQCFQGSRPVEEESGS